MAVPFGAQHRGDFGGGIISIEDTYDVREGRELRKGAAGSFLISPLIGER
jgi:hypothetical protein